METSGKEPQRVVQQASYGLMLRRSSSIRMTIMAKEKEPTEQERFAQTHPEGVFNP
jgi:hypothetical protein